MRSCDVVGFMGRIAPASGAGHGADRRAAFYIAPDADVLEAYRGIGVRIEDDIVISPKPVMKT